MTVSVRVVTGTKDLPIPPNRPILIIEPMRRVEMRASGHDNLILDGAVRDPRLGRRFVDRCAHGVTE